MSETIRTRSDLDRVAEAGLSALYPDKLKVLIGSASCGVAAGARDVEAAAAETIEKLGLDAVVSRTGCIGMCRHETMVDLRLPDGPRVSYVKMTARKTNVLLEAFAEGNPLVPQYALCRFGREEHVATGYTHFYAPSKNGVSELPEWGDLAFSRDQQRVILRNCGSIDPFDIEEAIARGAYWGAAAALLDRSPNEVIADVLESGLRGRGGGGFPTAKKWQIAHDTDADFKYVICNADEGTPGAFADRTLLESDPHALLEGLIIAGYAIGAGEGIVYTRSEYPLAVAAVQHAIDTAKEMGLLGENILGSGFSFEIRIRKGAGALVSGEETALIASIEGSPGEPRSRPPFPAESGLWGKPTVVNNAKTCASLGPILSRGAAWYSAMGTGSSPGTAVFALGGAVENTGLVEVPIGISLNDLVFSIGGGPKDKSNIKAVQAGGPSGGCLPAESLDVPLDFESLETSGTMFCAGGVTALDETTCLVDLARSSLAFSAGESCGKCAPCREGTAQMHAILDRICGGFGIPADLALLERLSSAVKLTSLCGLGGSAPNPVLSTLSHFKNEYEAHVHERKCPAGVCPALITLVVLEDLCSGCTLCTQVCAVGAISGERKSTHRIDAEICTRCGACRQVCPTAAVVAV
jgi:NADH:ubiquinone oxidoreductase subunit F (NADH-binding)